MNRLLSTNGSLVVLAALVLLAAPVGSRAGAGCGNFEGDDMVQIDDLVMGVNYLYFGGPLPLDFDSADVDNYRIYTLHDVAQMVSYLFLAGQRWCPPQLPPLYPPESQDEYVFYNRDTFPAHREVATVEFWIRLTDTLRLYNLPLRIRVDGIIPTIDSVTRNGFFHTQILRDSGVVFFRVTPNLYPLPPDWLPAGKFIGASVKLRMDSSSIRRPITITWDSLPPIQDGVYSHQRMIIGDYVNLPTRTPGLRYICCTGVRGNVDLEGIVDLADLSYLVAYLTAVLDWLPCSNEANVNGIGIVDLTDLSALVSYLTGGGYVLPNCP